MARQRDYAVQSGKTKKRKNSGAFNKTLLLIITALVVVLFAFALFVLKEKAPEPKPTAAVDKPQPKSQLPSRPEEVWSYIKELESRTVVTDNSQQALERNMQLSDKQKEELLRLEEKEKQAALTKAIEKLQAEEKKAEGNTSSQGDENALPASGDDAALKAQQAKAAELKKQAEQKKNQELKKAATIETAKPETVKAEERKKAEAAKEAKKEEIKKEAVKKTANSGGAKFGLQCGAFKNREQAENLQGRLVMTGLDARVSANSDWNRVFVGPVGDRAAAVSAQKKASAVINCVIIGM